MRARVQGSKEKGMSFSHILKVLATSQQSFVACSYHMDVCNKNATSGLTFQWADERDRDRRVSRASVLERRRDGWMDGSISSSSR